MERLEDRLLLSSGPVVIGDVADAAAKSLVYYDTDGTKVTVALKGGLATVNWGADGMGTPNWTVNALKTVATVGSAAAPVEIFNVLLAGTTRSSALTFITVKPLKSQADTFAEILGGIVGTTPIGTITAPKITFAGGYDNGGKMVAISVSWANTVAVGGVVSGALDFGGASIDKLSFTAKGSITSGDLTFGGTLTQLSLGGAWQAGSVTAAAITKVSASGPVGASITASTGGIGPVTLKGGSLSGALTAATSIGAVSVTGGDLSGSLTATAGPIGAVTVTGGNLTGSLTATAGSIGAVTVTGGNLSGALSAAGGSIGVIKVAAKLTRGQTGQADTIVGGDLTGGITAGQVKGKSITSITVTGGAIGTANQQVTINAAGSVGNISSTGTAFKDYFADGNGSVPFSNYKAGGVYVNLTIPNGSAGTISATGGDVSGTLAISGAVAGVTAKGVTVNDPQQADPMFIGGGITFADPGGGGFMAGSIGAISANGGDVSGSLSVGAVKGKSITSIAATGGAIGGGNSFTVTAAGSVGNISSTGMSYRQPYQDANTGATRFYNNYKTGGLNLSLAVTLGSVGTVSVTGGDAAGQITASGAVGGITTKGVSVTPPANSMIDPTYSGGGSTLDITAGKIGAYSLTGGDLGGTLTAPLIGAITCNVVTVNATRPTATTNGTDGLVYGGNIAVTLSMLTAGAQLGQVTAVGGTLSVDGQVTFDPATAKLTSRPVKYISTYTIQTDDNGVDHYVAENTPLGGPDSVTNTLAQA